MSVTFFIEVSEVFDAVTRVWRKAESQLYASTLEEAQSDQGQTPIVAILDGRVVACHNVQLPQVDDAKALKILPAVIDDKLAMSGEKQHIALLDERDEDESDRLVGVVAFDAMSQLRGLFAQLGLTVTSAIPDYMVLPVAADHEHTCELEGRTLVRRMDRSGYTIDAGDAEWMQSEVGQKSVNWQEMLAAANPIMPNLLQGVFAPRTDLRTTFLWWRRASILVTLLFILAVVSMWYGASENIRRADAAYAAAEQAFREALPDEPRIINMDAQLRRAIGSRGQQGGGEFFALSNVVMQVVNNNEQTLLETLRYEQSDGELALDVSFSSFAESSSFKRELEQAGMAVTEGSSRQEGGRVLSEIRVRRP